MDVSIIRTLLIIKKISQSNFSQFLSGVIKTLSQTFLVRISTRANVHWTSTMQALSPGCSKMNVIQPLR